MSKKVPYQNKKLYQEAKLPYHKTLKKTFSKNLIKNLKKVPYHV